jgi:hypothetical protein
MRLSCPGSARIMNVAIPRDRAIAIERTAAGLRTDPPASFPRACRGSWRYDGLAPVSISDERWEDLAWLVEEGEDILLAGIAGFYRRQG